MSKLNEKQLEKLKAKFSLESDEYLIEMILSRLRHTLHTEYSYLKDRDASHAFSERYILRIHELKRRGLL